MTDFGIAGINPEPWTSPQVSVGRRGGRLVPRVFKSAALAAYQTSVQEALQASYPDAEPLVGPVALEFWFWRQLIRYEGARRRSVKNRVDATNLQKACEDAIQGVLISNDRDVVHISSWVVEQAVDTEPLIVIRRSRPGAVPAWTRDAHSRYSSQPPAPTTEEDFDVERYF